MSHAPLPSPRDALAARIVMEREDYMLMCLVDIALLRPRSLTQVYDFAVGGSWTSRRWTTVGEVLRALATLEACGRCVVRRVRGRKDRYYSADPRSRPRRSKSTAWATAAEQRRAIVAMIRSWSREERETFYKAQAASPDGVKGGT